MSLWFCLEGDTPHVRVNSARIFVRRGYQTVEVTREEWDQRNPGIEPPMRLTRTEETNAVYQDNIPDEMIPMARETGLYECLWRPGKNAIRTAGQMLGPLHAGLERLRAGQARFRARWGDYESFERSVQNTLEACLKHPTARVLVWR